MFGEYWDRSRPQIWIWEIYNSNRLPVKWFVAKEELSTYINSRELAREKMDVNKRVNNLQWAKTKEKGQERARVEIEIRNNRFEKIFDWLKMVIW